MMKFAKLGFWTMKLGISPQKNSAASPRVLLIQGFPTQFFSEQFFFPLKKTFWLTPPPKPCIDLSVGGFLGWILKVSVLKISYLPPPTSLFGPLGTLRVQLWGIKGKSMDQAKKGTFSPAAGGAQGVRVRGG